MPYFPPLLKILYDTLRRHGAVLISRVYVIMTLYFLLVLLSLSTMIM